jgi:hypothetical protein
VTCLRCGERAVVAAMRTHGYKVLGTPWLACAKHAPKAGPSMDLIDLEVPK